MMLQNAKWIWLPGSESQKNIYVDFKVSLFPAEGEAPILELSADGNYAVYLNGTFVNSGQYPDYPAYKVYDRLEISSFTRPGENALLIRVWHPGEDHFSYRAEKAGLIFCVFSDTRILAQSGPNTLCAQNAAYQDGAVPILTSQLGYSFFYDARKAGTERFVPACLVEKTAALYPRPIRKLEIGERLPVTITNFGTFQERPYETIGQRMQYAALAARYQEPELLPAGGKTFTANSDDGIYLIFDLGKEQVGFADLELYVPEDALILCGYGEHLHDLRVRTHIGNRNFVFSYHAAAGKNHFFMPLRRLGLRYLQLHIYTHEVTVYYAGIRPATYPLEIYPLPIKDRLHRKIYETCVQTLRHCMHDHYEDTPWREQGLYTMDSRNEMLCGYDVFHETAFPKACLRLIALSVREDGLCELCSPARAPITIPSFSAIYLVQLWEYLEYTGDRDFLAEMLPYAEKIAESFIRHIDPQTGLLSAYTEKCYWNFYEWQDGLDGAYGVEDLSRLTFDAPLCAIVSLGLQAMEKILRMLAHMEKADAYQKIWKTLNERTEKAFWNGKWYSTYRRAADGTLYHDAQLTQALMICCSACPSEKLPAVRALLKNDTLLPVTLSYSIFKYDALMTDPTNYDWMLDDLAEIWGGMLFQGATTFWETAKGAADFQNAGSLCHGWSAVPLHLYHRYGAP